MKNFFISISFLFLFFPVYGQISNDVNIKKLTKDEKIKLDNAEFFYIDQNYLRALPPYLDLMDAHPDELYFKLRAGICYIYKSDEKEHAVELLEQVEQGDPKSSDINFYLGRAYHINNKFDQAIEQFNKYLAKNPPINQQLLAKRYIENSNNAKAYIELKVKSDITNLGEPINTEYSEYVPVISSDESILIYTYTGPRSTGGLMDNEFEPDPNGNYYEDVFVSNRVGDRWLTSESIGTNINTKNHDASIALSADGQQLFLFHSTEKDGGDIYISKLDGDIWSVPERLGPSINTKYWEGSCSLSADEQTLYFASDRPGGFGERDIYVSKKMQDGSWSVAKNLGPQINTSYNEDSPFIHPDGITLFFSSEGHKSMGGYDIMYSIFNDGKWEEPINLGYPINTTEDERFYVLTANGEHGYFSSDRKGGLGQQDIYISTPSFYGEKPVLTLVLGTVTSDDKAVSAKIDVSNAETGEKKGQFHSNSASGKYLIALTPGNNYKVAIEVEGQEAQIQYVNVKKLETFVQVQQDFKFYSESYKKENGIVTLKDSVNAIQTQINQQVEKYNEEKKVDKYEAHVYQTLLTKYGEEKKECVNYYVELGTFENPNDFNKSKFQGVGDLQEEKDSNGNTRFFYLGFKTLLDAEIFKYKVIDKDTALKNIIVTVNDCGKRKLVQQYYSNEYTRKDYTVPTETKIIKSIVKRTEMVETSANTEVVGLSYKLEIGSTDDGGEAKVKKLEKFGKIESKKYPDGKTHYTMGPFKTLAEAEAFKKMLTEKAPEAANAFVTVFFFGVQKTVEEYKNPCSPGAPQDFSYFVGKDLNNIEVYTKLINQAGGICAEGMIFRVQIGAYRKPQNFKHKNLNSLEPPPALVLPYPDGITRFTMRDFTTLKDAEIFRQECIRLGTHDAWITCFYKGNRMLLQELIANNFYNKKIN